MARGKKTKLDTGDKVRVAAATQRLPVSLHPAKIVRRMFQRPSELEPRPVDPPVPPPVRKAKTRPSAYLISFVGMVVIPAVIALIYLIFLASDQYVAEARFAVRKSQVEIGGDSKLSAMLSSLSSGGGLGGASNSLADQDAHIVANFLRSRGAVDEISQRLDIKALFHRPEADFWARLKDDPSIEELVDYWRKMVGAYVDGPSGIVTVTARAFRPQDAKRLVEEFITTSEALTNRLSERARRDAMRDSEEEVRRTEAKVRDAHVALRHYRDQEGFISPLESASATGKLLVDTMSERIKTQNDYFVASRALSETAPSVQGLKVRLESLDGQIEKLKAELTTSSGETRVISSSLVRFEALELQRIFAEKMYTLAQDALERARLRAERQTIYVSVFVPPSLPEDAKFPERLSSSLLIAIGLLLVWAVAALTAAAIEDHTI